MLRSTPGSSDPRQTPLLRSTPDTPPTERDRAVVLSAVRMRLLSYQHLLRSDFAGVQPSVVSRRMRQLEHLGWVTRWEERTPRGGHPRYVLPTSAAQRWASEVFSSAATGAPYERLLKLMLPRSARRPLELTSGTIPPWLAHQRDCNHLLLSLAECPDFRILWASSWDRPLPNEAAGVPLPQPDWVAVAEVDGTPRLVFGEHDRGFESLAHFRRAKVDRYSALASLPDFTEELFGFREFVVCTTVIDCLSQNPIRRLRALSDVASEGGGRGVFAFTLGGWAHAYPERPIWFVNGELPATESVALGDHEGGGLQSGPEAFAGLRSLV
ncbi:MAG: replication-relaxation family protein [Thermoanaerobaculia bacterium]